MPRRPSAKKYVRRKAIRDNPDLPRELRYVLDCAEHIRPKFMAVPTWLVASGPMGLNAAELGELSGLGIMPCENALDTLGAKSLVREEAPALPGEPSRWFPVLDYGQGDSEGQGSEEYEGKGDSKENKRGIINPEGIYNKSRCDILSLPNPDDKSDLKPGSLKSEPASCNRKGRNFAGLEENPNNVPDQSLTIEAGPSGVKILPAPGTARRRRKKLKEIPAPVRKQKKLKALPAPKKTDTDSGSATKKTEKRSPRAALADDLSAENKRRWGGKKTHRNYAKNPSENPAVLDWKQKPKPNRWQTLDWTGYWLHRWREYYGEEDPNFVGQTLYRTIRQSRESTRGGLDIYWQTGFMAEKFRDSTRTFKGNGEDMREFVDWLFDTFLPENAWMDTPVSASQIFRVTKNYFLDRFKTRNVKTVNGKKKIKGKRRHWGWDYNA